MSEVVKAQYTILSELRKIDEKVYRTQVEIEKIPVEVQKLNTTLEGRKAEFTKAKETFDATEKKLRKAEGDLKEKEDKLHKAEGKMMEVKTNEEYQAAMRENDAQKGEKSGLEESVLKGMKEVEEQRKVLKEVEATFKGYEEQIKKEISVLEGERQKLVKALEEQMAVRDAESTKLAPDIQSMYLKLAGRVKGSAVVNAENGTCLGCNMKVRPQLYNEILGYKAIHKCSSCGRILIIVSRDNGNAEDQIASK